MSYPYPQDRNRDRQEKGDQPYKDARQAMNENEASIQDQAEAFGEEQAGKSDEERAESLEADAEAGSREAGESRTRSETRESDS